MGVDNDEVLCELSDPPLSSVRLNNGRIGYEAAAMLDRLLHGKRPRRQETRIAPLGVVARRSTDLLAVADADVVAALRFIREHAAEGIAVTDVLAHVAVSASTLKRRFAGLVGRSPRAEILRVQLQRAQQLLATTHLPLREIARLTGFGQIQGFCKIFRAKTGCTPGRYRAATRAGDLH
jgi:LacI family transcriptional regulator